MATVYVDTDVSPGGAGTSGDPFATLTEALIPLRLAGSTSAPYDIYCQGVTQDTGASGAYSLDHSVWEFVTSPTNKVRIFGNNTSGKWNTNAYRIGVTNRAAIYNQYAAHVEIYNLQAQVKITDAGEHNCYRLSSANNDITNGVGRFLFQDCIGRTDPTSTNGIVRGFINSILGSGTDNLGTRDSRGVLDVVNSLFIGRAASDKGFNTDAGIWANAHVRHLNCTVAKCLYGFEDPALVKNSLAVDCGFGFIGTLVSGSDYLAEDDGNGIGGGGTHLHSATSFTFVDKVNGDYHLASTDTGARGLGVTDPSGTGAYPNDIDGQTRTGAWDLGADQYVAASSIVIPVFMNQYRQRRA